MKKTIILTAISGIIGFGILSCGSAEPRQEIILVTESIDWNNTLPSDSFTDSYGDNKEGKFNRKIDAIRSICSDFGPSKEEFREKVKSGEFRVIGSQKTTQGVEYYKWVGEKSFLSDAQCIGTEYVVEY